MDFTFPPKLNKGDKVAIVATGNGPAKITFPHIYALGIKRLKEVFGLEPVEYPTISGDPQYLTDHPEERAKDFMDALSDPEIKGIIAPIGGSGDLIKILKYIDPEAVKKNPKRFYGFSDNTSLCLWLWNQGIVSFQGPMVMTNLAMQGKMHDYTIEYCNRAFFEDSIGFVEPSDFFTDETLNWQEKENMNKEREKETSDGWDWRNAKNQKIEGRIWGGCYEILEEFLMSDLCMPSNDKLEGCVLVMETSEELPNADRVERFMMCLGERGLLEGFSAIIVGRAKARHFEDKPKEEREKFRSDQKEAIMKVVNEYNPRIPVIFDFNFGHADPIVPLPIGGIAMIDATKREIVIK